MSDGPTDQSSTGDRIPAFVNAKSGSTASIRDALGRDARFEPREAAPDEIPELIRAEASRAGGRRRVVVCGGDGTIAAAVGAAVGTSLELAVLAAGTLNHFARDYGLPLDPAEALEVAATASSQPIDVGVVNGRVMVNTASVGAYVDFVRHRESRERYLGYHLASLIAAVSVWFRPRWIEVGLRTDEGKRQSFRTPLLFVGVGEREFGRGGLGKRRPPPTARAPFTSSSWTRGAGRGSRRSFSARSCAETKSSSDSRRSIHISSPRRTSRYGIGRLRSPSTASSWRWRRRFTSSSRRTRCGSSGVHSPSYGFFG